MISSLKQITGSLLKSLDIIYVLEGIKPVSRLIFDGNEELPDFLLRNNLCYALSDFKIITHVDSTRGFSDKGIKVDKSDKRKGNCLIYISKKKELAEEAKKAEEKGDNIELGRLLGYPECCCRFFENNFKDASKGSMDLTMYTFKQSNGFGFMWQNNYCLRGFDISLISHFPCSFNCESSKKIAENNLKVIEKYDTDIASYFKSALKCAVLYSEGIGVFSFRKFRIDNSVMHYLSKDVVSSIKNDLSNIIMRRDRLRVLGKNHFLIGDVDIEDNHTFFGLFS